MVKTLLRWNFWNQATTLIVVRSSLVCVAQWAFLTMCTKSFKPINLPYSSLRNLRLLWSLLIPLKDRRPPSNLPLIVLSPPNASTFWANLPHRSYPSVLLRSSKKKRLRNRPLSLRRRHLKNFLIRMTLTKCSSARGATWRLGTTNFRARTKRSRKRRSRLS